MKYMGSKRRIVKEILPIMLKNRTPNQWYIEPFAGGMNVIEHVDGLRAANDTCSYLISMFSALIDCHWEPPKMISEEEYQHIKNNKELYPRYLVGYVGYNSYGGKFFGGYRRDKAGLRDYWDEHFRHMQKQISKLQSVGFTNRHYAHMSLPLKPSVIYCDPPYVNTTKYKSNFDHEAFWNWVRDISKVHKVFVSEYVAPDDFISVWSKPLNNTLVANTGAKKGIEQLFIHESQKY